MSERTPVEVSACTAAMIFGDGCAAATFSGSTGSPNGKSTRVTSAPQRAATSHIRSPNRPLTAITTGSPGFTKFTNAASMPAEPVADSGRVRRFSVPHTFRSPSHALSMTARNWGSRWPSSGRASASVASGYGLVGPGPNRWRTVMISLMEGSPDCAGLARVLARRCPRENRRTAARCGVRGHLQSRARSQPTR